jgi:hypothetical protein
VRLRPLSDGNDDQIVPDDEGFWRRLNPDEQVVLPVEGLDCVRVRHRALMQPGVGGIAAWRLEAAFDEDAAHPVLAHAPADPEAPEVLDRPRADPGGTPGARQLRVRAAGSAVLLQVIGTSPKPAWATWWDGPTPPRCWRVARSAGGWAGRLAAAPLPRTPRRLDEATGAPRSRCAAGAVPAQRVRDPALAERLLTQARERLQAGPVPLERAAARPLAPMVVTPAAERAVAAGRAAEAAMGPAGPGRAAPPHRRGRGGAAGRRTPSPPSRSRPARRRCWWSTGCWRRTATGPRLALARQRAFTGAARWQELSIDSRAARRLLPGSAAAGHPAPCRPKHALFSPVPPGDGRTVELPEPPLPGHQPMLSLVALRAPRGPAVLRVKVDDVPHTLPAVGPFERVESPGPARPPQVTIGETRTGARLYANFTPTDASGARLRRYIQWGPPPSSCTTARSAPATCCWWRCGGGARPAAPARVRFELHAARRRHEAACACGCSPGALSARGPARSIPTGRQRPHRGAGAGRHRQPVVLPGGARAPGRAAHPGSCLPRAGATPRPHRRDPRGADARGHRPGAGPATRPTCPRWRRSAASLGATGEGAAATDFLAAQVALSGLDEPTLAREDLVPRHRQPHLCRRWRNAAGAVRCGATSDNVASSAHPATVAPARRGCTRPGWASCPSRWPRTGPPPWSACWTTRAALRGLGRRRSARTRSAAAGGGLFALLAAARQGLTATGIALALPGCVEQLPPAAPTPVCSPWPAPPGWSFRRIRSPTPGLRPICSRPPGWIRTTRTASRLLRRAASRTRVAAHPSGRGQRRRDVVPAAATRWTPASSRR